MQGEGKGGEGEKGRESERDGEKGRQKERRKIIQERHGW